MVSRGAVAVNVSAPSVTFFKTWSQWKWALESWNEIRNIIKELPYKLTLVGFFLLLFTNMLCFVSGHEFIAETTLKLNLGEKVR